jgi:ATP-dependent Clp protease protease subunit
MAIYDTMQLIHAPVSTIAVGMAASMGTILLTAGTKGKRYALPNATIHLHQPLGGVQGQAVDIEIEAREILRIRDLLNNVLKRHTGLSDEDINKYTDRNFYMTPERAKELGVIDDVLSSAPKGEELK